MCEGCIFYYYERDTNWKECKYVGHDELELKYRYEECEHYYSKEDACLNSHSSEGNN